MYVTVSLRKMVHNKGQAEAFTAVIREKVEDQEEMEIVAVFVDEIHQEVIGACPQPPS